MDNEVINFQVGQSFGTFNGLKAKLEAMSTTKRENIDKKYTRKEECTSYLDEKGVELGFVLAGTEHKYSGERIKKEDIKNKGLIKIGKFAFFIPTIRDGKGGQVKRINYDGATIAIDRDGDGIIGEDELQVKNIKDIDKK